MDPSKILIWNVRGLNSRARQDSVRELALSISKKEELRNSFAHRRFHFEAFWPKLEGFHDTDEIKDFRKNFIATLAAALNSAYITLIPKKEGAEHVKDFSGLSESLGASFRNSYSVVFLMFASAKCLYS
ncbi:hypothetical protein ACJX0J_005862 [Zea mays]